MHVSSSSKIPSHAELYKRLLFASTRKAAMESTESFKELLAKLAIRPADLIERWRGLLQTGPSRASFA